MDSHQVNPGDDGDFIEEWLESELVPDDDNIRIPLGVRLPSKIRWISSDGANVVTNQLLATFSPVTQSSNDETDHQMRRQRTEKKRLLSNDEDNTAETVSSASLTFNNDGKLYGEANHICQTKEGDKVIAREMCSDDAQHSGDINTKVTAGAEEIAEAHKEQYTEGVYLLRSTIHGTLKHCIRTESVITDNITVIGRIDNVKCSHSVVIHGICVSCCQVVDEPFPKRHRNSSIAPSKMRAAMEMTGRASARVVPGFLTNDNAVRVDAYTSNEMELLEILRLLQKRKLCLVLDLDNTLIHSSCSKQPDDIDIPVIDLFNTSNGYKLQFDDEAKMRSYEKELEASVLVTRTLNEMESRFFVNYYKLRPGVYEFLRQASKLYELYLFTMGTRPHAHAALKILDPSGTYFGNRIFSRTEANHNFKSLSRIFPNYRNLLLIIDDSESIWENAPGLIKVYPYYYFTAYNLVKNRDPMNLSRVAAALQAPCNYSNYTWESLVMEIWRDNEAIEVVPCDDDGFAIPMNVKDPGPRKASFRYNNMLIANERPSSIFSNCEDHTSVTTSQNSIEVVPSDVTTPAVTSNPNVESLATKEVPPDPSTLQSTSGSIEGNVKPIASTPATSKESIGSFSDPFSSSRVMMRKVRQIHVKDCDAQLSYMTTLLKEMHRQFFNSIDATDLKLHDLKRQIESKRLPDVGLLLTKHRKNLLKGVVLSVKRSDFRRPHGGEDFDFLRHSDLGVSARQFGVVPPSARNAVTHYLSNNASTVAPRAGVKKVHTHWLEACIYTWTHVDEAMFDSDGWAEPYRTCWDVIDASNS